MDSWWNKGKGCLDLLRFVHISVVCTQKLGLCTATSPPAYQKLGPQACTTARSETTRFRTWGHTQGPLLLARGCQRVRYSDPPLGLRWLWQLWPPGDEALQVQTHLFWTAGIFAITMSNLLMSGFMSLMQYLGLQLVELLPATDAAKLQQQMCRGRFACLGLLGMVIVH